MYSDVANQFFIMISVSTCFTCILNYINSDMVFALLRQIFLFLSK